MNYLQRLHFGIRMWQAVCVIVLVSMILYVADVVSSFTVCVIMLSSWIAALLIDEEIK